MTGETRDGAAAARQERAERIRATGPDITPDNIAAMFGLYAAAHERRGYTAPALARDLQYGPDPRHRLDVHSAHPGSADAAAAPAAPVLIYVHGGGFVSGDKTIAGTPYYDNVAAWVVSHGMVGVTMTYRLAPEHPWPAGAQDVGRAVGWVTEHIGGYGGDPARVVVAGHSAGATHVAGYLGGQAGEPAAVTAGALLSGVYDLTISGDSRIQAAYFGADTGLYAARSPLPGLVASGIPAMVGLAEIDPPFMHRQAAAALKAFLRRDGTLPPLAYALGHNHISEIASLGIDDEPLGVPLLRFIETVTGTVLPRPGYAEPEPAPAS
jgi:acetyl esterase/lipase